LLLLSLLLLSSLLLLLLIQQYCCHSRCDALEVADGPLLAQLITVH
jgi:hypothetical protein